MPTLRGTFGNDNLFVPGGNNNLTSYTIFGLGGNDTLRGGGGRDVISAGSGSSLLDGGNGNDILNGSFGDDTLLGGSGNDTVTGGGGNDFVDGGIGNDIVVGGLGDDFVFGNDGNDTVDGGLGDDVVNGGGGNDSLTASLGDDILFGGTGNDSLSGGPGNDIVAGGQGSDTLNGFGGASGTLEVDYLIGGGFVDSDGFVDDPFAPSARDGVRDTFVLGNATTSFYTNDGDNDFAVIFGFETSDVVAISPSLGVALGVGTVIDPFFGGVSGTLLYANLSTGLDLIGVLVDVSPNSLTSANFIAAA